MRRTKNTTSVTSSTASIVSSATQSKSTSLSITAPQVAPSPQLLQLPTIKLPAEKQINPTIQKSTTTTTRIIIMCFIYSISFQEVFPILVTRALPQHMVHPPVAPTRMPPPVSPMMMMIPPQLPTLPIPTVSTPSQYISATILLSFITILLNFVSSKLMNVMS